MDLCVALDAVTGNHTHSDAQLLGKVVNDLHLAVGHVSGFGGQLHAFWKIVGAGVIQIKASVLMGTSQLRALLRSLCLDVGIGQTGIVCLALHVGDNVRLLHRQAGHAGLIGSLEETTHLLGSLAALLHDLIERLHALLAIAKGALKGLRLCDALLADWSVVGHDVDRHRRGCGFLLRRLLLLAFFFPGDHSIVLHSVCLLWNPCGLGNRLLLFFQHVFCVSQHVFSVGFAHLLLQHLHRLINHRVRVAAQLLVSDGGTNFVVQRICADLRTAQHSRHSHAGAELLFRRFLVKNASLTVKGRVSLEHSRICGSGGDALQHLLHAFLRQGEQPADHRALTAADLLQQGFQTALSCVASNLDCRVCQTGSQRRHRRPVIVSALVQSLLIVVAQLSDKGVPEVRLFRKLLNSLLHHR